MKLFITSIFMAIIGNLLLCNCQTNGNIVNELEISIDNYSEIEMTDPIKYDLLSTVFELELKKGFVPALFMFHEGHFIIDLTIKDTSAKDPHEHSLNRWHTFYVFTED